MWFRTGTKDNKIKHKSNSNCDIHFLQVAHYTAAALVLACKWHRPHVLMHVNILLFTLLKKAVEKKKICGEQ